MNNFVFFSDSIKKFFIATLVVQGDIKINGYLVDSSFMQKHSGYMHQDDIFIGSMTVSEHLWFMVIIILLIEKFYFIFTYNSRVRIVYERKHIMT